MSAAGDNGVKKAFQTALRSREAEADAEAKVQATLGGSVSIAVCHTVTPQGQQEEYLTVTYKKQRTSVEETVQYIPELLLVAILESLTESDDSNEHNRYSTTQQPCRASGSHLLKCIGQHLYDGFEECIQQSFIQHCPRMKSILCVKCAHAIGAHACIL
eukprot:m.803389 g.803389  ORF g.803389 m.803389 type:complete len:159 (+) comp23365_c0_seq2:1873-2349(+)